MKTALPAIFWFVFAAPIIEAAPHYYVVDAMAAGSGCTSGDATVTQLDPSWFMVNFGDFTAKNRPGQRLSEGRVFCQTLVELSYPSGWQFKLDGLWLFGLDVNLGPSAKGEVHVSTYLQGQRATGRAEKTYVGAKRWHGQLDIHPEGQWSSCGGNAALNVKVDLRAQGRASYAYMALRDKAKFRLKWRRC